MKRKITKLEFNQLAKAMDKLDILKEYEIVESPEIITKIVEPINTKIPNFIPVKEIKLAEHHPIQTETLNYSKFWARIAMYLSDCLFVVIIIRLIAEIFLRKVNINNPSFDIFSVTFGYSIIIIYYTVSECIWSVSPAKKLFGYKTIQLKTKQKISIWQVFIRTFVRTFPFISFPLAGIISLLTLMIGGKNQTLWDRATNSVVIKT